MPADAPSGLWIATGDRDYIVTPENASPARHNAIVCHELAHMLLGHEGSLGMHAASIAPGIDPAVAARFLGRHAYDNELEHSAETLGTQLAAEVAALARYGLERDLISTRLR